MMHVTFVNILTVREICFYKHTVKEVPKSTIGLVVISDCFSISFYLLEFY